MPLIERITLTYTQRIQLAPYNHVDAGLVVQVAPHPEDGPDAMRDLAGLIAMTWEAVAHATHLQIETAVSAFDRLLEERRQRPAQEETAAAPSGSRNGASFTPAGSEAMTAKQREIISGLRDHLGWSDADVATFATQWGVELARLTRREAQSLIQELCRVPKPPAPPVESSSAHPNPPKTPNEAKKRFFARYGAAIGGDLFAHVRSFLNEPTCPEPRSVDEWVRLAERIRDILANTAPTPPQTT